MLNNLRVCLFMVGLIRHLHSSDQLIVTSPHPDKRPIILNSLKMIDQIKKRIQFSSFASIPPPPPPPPPPTRKNKPKLKRWRKSLGREKLATSHPGNASPTGVGGRGGCNISGQKCYLCLSFYFLYCDGNKYCHKNAGVRGTQFS